jgi:methane monooxygenase PmoA-like
MYRMLLSFFVCAIVVPMVFADANVRVEEQKDGGIAIIRPTAKAPLLVFNAPKDSRPFIHPLLAPDGTGTITEFSPGHHKHQTGIYVGFLKVNGRDYFHNRGGDHFRRTGFKHDMNSEGVRWMSTYELLDKDKKPQLVETQSWHFRDFTKNYLIDFTWSAKANADITFDKYDYGGLFLRMPWKNQPGARAINSEGQVNGKAEGQKASWVDIGMTVDGRKDDAHIAVIAREPVLWRVDGQLGVGPAPSRAKAWALKMGETATFHYRLYVYTGEFQNDQVQAQSVAFQKNK